jgi:hypothetical protein
MGAAHGLFRYDADSMKRFHFPKVSVGVCGIGSFVVVRQMFVTSNVCIFEFYALFISRGKISPEVSRITGEASQKPTNKCRDPSLRKPRDLRTQGVRLAIRIAIPPG